jgi:rRNA maturation endonuclease Nob1
MPEGHQDTTGSRLPEFDEIMCWRCKRFFPLAELRIAHRGGRKLCERCTDKTKPNETRDPWL